MEEVKRKINVVQFTPYFPPHVGGVEQIAYQWAKGWKKKGYGNIVTVTFSVGQKTGITEFIYDDLLVYILPGFEIIENFPLPKLWSPRFWTLIKKITSEEACIYQTHTRFFLSTFLGGFLAKLYGKTRVHIEHGSGYVQGYTALIRFLARLYDCIFGRIIFKFSDMNIAISEKGKEFIHKFSKNNVIVIYNGITFLGPLVEGRRLNDIGHPHISIGYVGRLSSLKGVKHLINVIKKMISLGIPVKLGIIGDGSEKQKLMEMSKDFPDISFYGKKSREWIMNNFLPETKIFVNPSYQEGLPTSVIEALGSGCRVIATNVGGTSEIYGGNNMHLFEPGNESSLFEKLISCAALKTDVSVAKTVRKNFSTTRMVSNYYKTYVSLTYGEIDE